MPHKTLTLKKSPSIGNAIYASFPKGSPQRIAIAKAAASRARGKATKAASPRGLARATFRGLPKAAGQVLGTISGVNLINRQLGKAVANRRALSRPSTSTIEMFKKIRRGR